MYVRYGFAFCISHLLPFVKPDQNSPYFVGILRLSASKCATSTKGNNVGRHYISWGKREVPFLMWADGMKWNGLTLDRPLRKCLALCSFKQGRAGRRKKSKMFSCKSAWKLLCVTMGSIHRYQRETKLSFTFYTVHTSVSFPEIFASFLESTDIVALGWCFNFLTMLINAFQNCFERVGLTSTQVTTFNACMFFS